MLRNLDRRVEVAVPILDPELKKFIKDELLPAYLRDNVNARTLRSDGTYKRISSPGSEHFSSQMYFCGKDILA